MNKSAEPTMSLPNSTPQPQIISTTVTVVKPVAVANGVSNTPQIAPTSTVNSAAATTTATASTILSPNNDNSPDITVIRREIKSAMVMEPVPKKIVNASSSSSVTSTSTTSTTSTTKPKVDGVTITTTNSSLSSSSSSSVSVPVTTSAAASATQNNSNNSSTNANTVTAGQTTTTTTAASKESSGSSNTSVAGKDEKSVESSNSNSNMEPRNQIILNPLKTNTVNSTSSSSSGNKSVPQDVNQITTKSKAPEPAPLGKDVTTVIGRIEQVRGLTGSSQLSALAGGPNPSPSPRSGIAGKGNVVDVNNSSGEKPERPPRTRTAHDFGTSSEATPKTPNQRIRARTTANSARAASASASASGAAKSTSSSHRVSTTVSAKSFAEASPNNNVRNKSERPATASFTRPTTSSTFKGISNYSPSTTLKSNRSYSAIRTHQKMGDAAGDATNTAAVEKTPEKPATLKDQFAVYCRFGDTSSDGKSISLSNSDKWLKQAKIIDGKKITTTDTSISFKKLFKTAKKVNFEDYKKYLEDLATSKKIEVGEIHDKLINCGTPGLSSATKANSKGVIERLTDTSKYTGSHKERFDASGKGKGIEGRREVKDSSGYVQGAKIVPK